MSRQNNKNITLWEVVGNLFTYKFLYKISNTVTIRTLHNLLPWGLTQSSDFLLNEFYNASYTDFLPSPFYFV